MRYPKIRFSLTDHSVTILADAVLPRLYPELIGLLPALGLLLEPFVKASNNQIPTRDVLLACWHGLLLSAEWFVHVTRYRHANYSPVPAWPRSCSITR